MTTGEEEEDSVYQVRGKLFTLSTQNQWKERGTGMLRLNVRREDGGGARLGEYWLLLIPMVQRGSALMSVMQLCVRRRCTRCCSMRRCLRA